MKREGDGRFAVLRYGDAGGKPKAHAPGNAGRRLSGRVSRLARRARRLWFVLRIRDGLC